MISTGKCMERFRMSRWSVPYTIVITVNNSSRGWESSVVQIVSASSRVFFASGVDRRCDRAPPSACDLGWQPISHDQIPHTPLDSSGLCQPYAHLSASCTVIPIQLIPPAGDYPLNMFVLFPPVFDIHCFIRNLQTFPTAGGGQGPLPFYVRGPGVQERCGFSSKVSHSPAKNHSIVTEVSHVKRRKILWNKINMIFFSEKGE